jgi:COMPASS component SWD3
VRDNAVSLRPPARGGSKSPDPGAETCSEPDRYGPPTKAELVVQEGHSVNINAVAVSPNQRVVATGEYYNARIKLWDMSTGRLIRTIQAEADYSSLSFSPDSELFAAASTFGTVELFDVTTG